MGATLHNSAPIENQNLVGVFNGLQSLGNDKGGTFLHQFPECSLNEKLSIGINTGSRIIEDKDAWIDK